MKKRSKYDADEGEKVEEESNEGKYLRKNAVKKGVREETRKKILWKWKKNK